jgi:hypothetical protein
LGIIEELKKVDRMYEQIYGVPAGTDDLYKDLKR